MRCSTLRGRLAAHPDGELSEERNRLGRQVCSDAVPALMARGGQALVGVVVSNAV